MAELVAPPANAPANAPAPETLPAAPPAADAAPAQPKPEAAKPKALPYARPAKPEASAAAPAAPAVEAPKTEGKPPANRAAAMQRARADKLAAELEAMKKSASSVDSMRKVLAGYADDAVKPLSKEWQDHLRELAGDDPARLLELVRKTSHLRVSAAPAAPPAPAPKLPSTAPAQGGPNGQVMDPDVALLSQYEQLKRDGKMIVAAQFAERNRAAIQRGEAKRAPKN